MFGKFVFFIYLIFIISNNLAHSSSIGFKGIDLGQSLDFRSNKAIELKKSKLNVIVFTSSICPCSDSHISPLKNLAKKYKDRVSFYAIHSNSSENRQESIEYYKKQSLPFPVLEDINSKFARALRPVATPHVYVFNQENELIYRGGVDDRSNHLNAKTHFLKEVLEAASQQKNLPYQQTRALGCPIDYQM